MIKRKRTYIVLLLILAIAVLLRPPKIEFFDKPYSAIINDENGNLLSAHIASDEQWRLPIVDSLPYTFEKAIVTYEDKRFYSHIGIDFIAIIRAIKENAQAKKVVSGASTLTMQVARLSYDHPTRTLWQKIKEASLALRIDTWYSKKDILRWYTSLAPYGGNIVGIRAAAWRYFEKNPDQLSWAEAATLAVLPNSPSLINVNRNRSKLLEKRNGLLHSLFKNEGIDSITYEAALLESLPDKTYTLPSLAPHLVHAPLSNRNKAKINKQFQFTISNILKYNYRRWSKNDIQNAGVLVIDTKSGDVLAYVGNIPDTKNEKDVDMVLARRSSGSILKPFLYAAMVNEGLIYPKSLVKDVPIFINGFSPSNYNNSHQGLVPADQALQQSLNIPAVLMLQQYGIAKFLAVLKKYNFSTLNNSADHYGLSLILGGGEVTLWDAVHAYRKLAKDAETDGGSFITLESLQELRRPVGEGDWKRFDSAIPISWKTGTSYGHRDAWAIGVTPDITIGVWVGNADGEGREGIVGITLAGKTMFQIINSLDIPSRQFTPPFEEMQFTPICKQSGNLPNRSCPKIDTLYLPNALKSGPTCKYHNTKYVTKNGDHLVTESCIDNLEYHSKVYFETPPIAGDYYKRNNPSIQDIPPMHPLCSNLYSQKYIDIIYPSHKDNIYLPKDLQGSIQDVVVKAVHKQENATLYWYLDKQYLGKTSDWHNMAVKPKSGDHSITIIDENGNRIRRDFTIVGDD